jgi:hypothetical protein
MESKITSIMSVDPYGENECNVASRWSNGRPHLIFPTYKNGSYKGKTESFLVNGDPNIIWYMQESTTEGEQINFLYSTKFLR